MKITPDTNILVRALVRDDVQQAEAATKLLKKAELIAVTLPSLCELAWVLRRVYNYEPQQLSSAIKALMGASNVVARRPAVEAGLAILEQGGDFADGVIAFEGSWLGGETFVSFDKKAVTMIARQGQRTELLSPQ